MTYEELLTMIDIFTGVKYDAENNQVTYSNPTGNWLKVNQSYRAIVEIHHPDEFNTHCRGCEAIPYESCPTYQAIEKELQ